MSSDNQGVCRSKKGFFFLRDCKAPANTACDSCGRPICPEHQRLMAGKFLCQECAGSGPSTYQKPAKDGEYFENNRNDYYSNYSYRPLYFGRHRYYSDHDFNSVDDKIVDHGSDKALAEATPGNELDDPLES